MSARWLRRVGVFEGLERRQVLAGNPVGGVVELSDGVLSVTGTNKNDSILVSLHEGQLKVVVNKAVHFFNLGDVSSLAIDARGGHDTVKVAYDVLVDAWINGGGGNDKIWAGGGYDAVYGGTGDDTLDGGGGDDWVSGDAGHDKVNGGVGNDSLHGGAGHDKLNGNEGDDELFGDWGHDKLYGGDGNDWLAGGAGHDELWGQVGDDMLNGEAGHDKLSGGWGNDELFGGDGADQLNGNEDNDFLSGEGGHDKLQGAAGDDKLKGGWGNDQLDGGAGVNLLDGDEGKNKLKNGTETDLDVQQQLVPLVACLSGPGVTVTVEFEPGEPTVLSVRASGGNPTLSVDIVINGLVIGQITFPGEGGGTSIVRFSSIPEDGEFELPDGLNLQVGSTVGIGNDPEDLLEGTFELAE